MLPYPLIVLITIVSAVVVCFMIYVGTGSIFSVFVIITLFLITGYLVSIFGLLKITVDNGVLNIALYETAPSPSVPKRILPVGKPLAKKEVFYVSGNNYIYDDAPAVCGALGADLATYDQLLEGYSLGADWCGYGWTQGGMAMFPTQQTTWQTLQGEVDQTKRTSCGRVGINGGYFDVTTKFGVNCYGVKPKQDETTSPVANLVNKFKKTALSVSPFNKSGWSEWNLSSHT